MIQPIKKGSGSSREREFAVILKDLLSKFRVFGEGMDDVQRKLGGIEIRLDKIEHRLDRIEFRLDAVELRLDGIEIRLVSVEDYIRFLKVAFPTVATKDDLLALERRLNSRITALETSHS